MPKTDLTEAAWIWWPQRRSRPNQYVCFRKSFTLARKPRKAIIDLSVDSNFVLYINGKHVGQGQYSDWPHDKTWTRYPITDRLRRGRNVIAVLAHHIGSAFSTYCPGRPGLIVAMRADDRVVVSDGSWSTSQHPSFRHGRMPWITKQLGYPFVFDARRDLPWWRLSCPLHGWEPAQVLAGATDGYWRDLSPRPVPALPLGPRLPVTVVMQGNFRRVAESATPALAMKKDSLVTERPSDVFELPDPTDEHDYPGPPANPGRWLDPSGTSALGIRPPRRGTQGRFLVLDLGSETSGWLALSLTAPAGTLVDIGHGEHLDDGRVRTAVGGRNFADRYICHAGHNTFVMPFRRVGARYLQLHLSAFRSPVQLHYAGLHACDSPLKVRGQFTCDDTLECRLHDIGVRTLQLSAHEHYEDCPWREQALYNYDGRIQALYGYYVFGGYDYAAACWDLMGRGQRKDGLLELCAPAKVNVNIPIFSLTWITSLAEHWLHSGRPTLFRRFRPTIDRILEPMLQRHDEATGLYRLSQETDHWQFYEWTPGLSPTIGDPAVARQHHAGFNLYLHEALGSYAWMCRKFGDNSSARTLERRRQNLGHAIHDVFWAPREGRYATYRIGRARHGGHEHIQVLALLHRIVPHPERRRVLSHIYAERLPSMTLSSMIYMLRLMLDSDASGRRFLAALIRRLWHPMALTDATSFWETRHGGDDFFHAGSLCHGWSTAPVYYHQAGILGIRPLDPGFARFRISPFPDHLARASGSVPTPKGLIRITWQQRDRGLEIEASGPKSLEPVLKPFPEAPVLRARYNGRRLDRRR